MSVRITYARAPLALDAGDAPRCARAASARSAARGAAAARCWSALTVRVAPDVDPSAVAFASRAAGEPWFCFEQPDRDGAALAAVGCVRRIDARGPRRFAEVAARLARAGRRAPWPTRPTGPPGAGLVAVGGFAFAPDGGAAPHWDGFAPRVADRARRSRWRAAAATCALTLAALAAPDDVPEELARALAARARRAARAAAAAARPRARSGASGSTRVAPPEHYEEAVARAVERIRAGALREDRARPRGRRPRAARRTTRPPSSASCAPPSAPATCSAPAAATRAFVAASPELLVRREGPRASTVALAGSTRRSADPAVDDHLGEQLLRSDKDREEQAIVARRIARALRPHAVWVAAPDEPTLIKVANIQHLATPIRAQLTHPLSAVELAGLLHPTPAVGGEPHAAAAPQIPALEGLDRGWYAGAVGWTDANEDGEFCVALRCALLRGREARLYAGVGVVRDSDPAAELAETEIKLGALLPILAG